MYNGKKIVAIIPARSGSKGLKDKNIKLLNGKPLLAYTIEAALNSDVFDYILFTSDSKEYCEIAKKYGAQTPFLRPDSLSSDTSSSADVILHGLEELEALGHSFDYFMMLQPTSPLRRSEDIVNAVDLLIGKCANSIVSVCKEKHPPLWSNVLDETYSMDNFLRTDAIRRQDINSFYRLNGAIYLSDIEYYKEHNNFYHQNSYAYVMDEKHSVDIDEVFDFIFAECVMKTL